MSEVRPPGSVFFYPCAGYDIAQPILDFGTRFATFIFVDIGYRFSQFNAPTPLGWSEVANSVVLQGPPVDTMRITEVGKHRYRDIKPAWRKSRYFSADSGRDIEVIFRRGFGQYALHELSDGSLGMFLHRGDSAGEGGSRVTYLGNRHMDHAPISMLMEVLKRKLDCPALVGSDGSNTSIRELRAAGQGDETISKFVSHGLNWERVGAMTAQDSRQSVLWQVTPLR